MSEDRKTVLIVDDERTQINVLNEVLKESYQIKVALSGKEAIERAFSEPRPDLILLDIMLPDMDGYQVLERLKQDLRTSTTPVIFLTSLNDEENEATGFKLGAADYITKPFSPAIVKARVHTQLSLMSNLKEALRARALEEEVEELSRSLLDDKLKKPEHFSELITSSPRMHDIFRYMEAISTTTEPVLVTGETGSGKELIAQSLHRLSGRSGKLVAINTAGLDDFAFSDSLFGHVKGAFSSADQVRKGLISRASGGTLFLDEIGDLSMASQVKLLRLLQDGYYYPLGSDIPVKMDLAVVTATNHDLFQATQEGRFRQDLFFRLSAHHITLPPLRERIEDISVLVAYFIKQASATTDIPDLAPSSELLKLLELYDFPGNIRELRAMVFDAVAQHKRGAVLSMDSFRQSIEKRRSGRVKFRSSSEEERTDSPPLRLEGKLPTLKEMESKLVTEAMNRAGNNQGIAASLLGISRPALNRRLQKQS